MENKTFYKEGSLPEKNNSSSKQVTFGTNFSNNVDKLEETDNFFFEDEISNEEYDSYDFEDEYEERTYNKYRGSYAQDVEGWSDQDIDEVFDGDPDAYWNID